MADPVAATAPPAAGIPRKWIALGPLLAGILIAAIGREWILGLAAALLVAAWLLLQDREGPPVLALAFSFQWLQATAAPFYEMFSGRRVKEMGLCDWRPMTLLALGCLAALLAGLVFGTRIAMPRPPSTTAATAAPPVIPFRLLVTLYLATTVLGGTLYEIAYEYPGLTQGILALGFLRLALLFLVLRRLVRPRLRPGVLLVVMAFETVVGLSGYFAGFREPFMMAALAILEAFEPRRPSHWASFAGVTAAAVGVAIVWTAVKGEYRKSFREDAVANSQLVRVQQIDRLAGNLVSKPGGRVTSAIDRTVSRLWAIPYQAMALERVPSALPHTQGAMVKAAVAHIFMPRLFFPNKAPLPSDSDMVRKYAGVWVAGARQGTSIAFGYTGESYIDFGVPWMFMPSLVFGFVMGLAFGGLRRAVRNRDVAVAAGTAIFWLALYLFEKSWAKMLGVSGTLLIFVGGAAVFIDRLVFPKSAPSPSVPPVLPVPPKHR